MSAPQNILITSASGNIGQHLVPFLLNNNPELKLVLPTSSTAKLRSTVPSISTSSNVYIEEGSIIDPVWFQSLLTTHNIDTVFLNLTGADELFTALNCLDALSRVPSVRRLVYLSVIGDFISTQGFEHTVRTRGYPHVFAKVLMEQRLKHAEFPFTWTVLGPTLLYSNDERQKHNILERSFFSAPLSGRGVDMVSLDDIALAARNVMFDTEGVWAGKKISLGSKRTYTGSEILDIWSKALGKPMKGFFSNDKNMDMWESKARTMMKGDHGQAWARDMRVLFEFLMREGITMSDGEYDEQVRLLGKEPADYQDWVKVTAEKWLKESVN